MSTTCNHPTNERTSRICHGFLGDKPAGTIEWLCSGCGTDITEDVEWEQYEAQAVQMCECEIDWNCGCGRYGGATWIETRYQGLDDEEERQAGRPYWGGLF